MSTRVLVLAAAACAAAVTAVAGQPPPSSSVFHSEDARHYEGPAVSLADVIQNALASNPGLAAMRQVTDAARQRPAQARAFSPPMIDATVWQWPIGTLNPSTVNMYMFMLQQDLPGPGKRSLRAALAEKDVALSDIDAAIRARQIVNEVKQAYAALFVARKSVDVHLASVDLLRQLTDVAQVKYATGRISQQDVLKPVLELAKLHTDIAMLDEQAGIAAARLNALLDRAPETPIGPLEEPPEEALLPDTAALQELAIAHQPDLQRAQLEVERGEAELAVAASDRKPDFSVQGGYLLMPNQQDSVLARVGVTWPNAPWSRAKLNAHAAELAAEIESAKSRKRSMENAVRLAVQEAYVHAKSAQERAALLRTTILPQSQQVIEVARNSYQTDRLDFQSVIDDERTLLGSELDYVRAVSDFQQAAADLEFAVGADLPAGTTATVAAAQGEVR